MNMAKSEIDIQRIETLFEKISTLIEHARQHVYRTVNTAEVYTKFGIGRYIIEDEQQGNYRAAYGKAVLKGVSAKLTAKFGKGWSVESLTLCRKFYAVYSNFVNSDYEIENEFGKQCLRNSQTPGNQTTTNIRNAVSEIRQPKFTLTWSHYLVLMRIDNPDERSFYEIECARQMWSVRQLQRQHASSLYERLALSRDKDEVMRLAKEGQTVEKPQDIIKNPVTLEFLGLKPEAAYSESEVGVEEHHFLSLSLVCFQPKKEIFRSSPV
jgi:hypothetical protein